MIFITITYGINHHGEKIARSSEIRIPVSVSALLSVDRILFLPHHQSRIDREMEACILDHELSKLSISNVPSGTMTPPPKSSAIENGLRIFGGQSTCNLLPDDDYPERDLLDGQEWCYAVLDVTNSTDQPVFIGLTPDVTGLIRIPSRSPRRLVLPIRRVKAIQVKDAINGDFSSNQKVILRNIETDAELSRHFERLMIKRGLLEGLRLFWNLPSGQNGTVNLQQIQLPRSLNKLIAPMHSVSVQIKDDETDSLELVLLGSKPTVKQGRKYWIIWKFTFMGTQTLHQANVHLEAFFQDQRVPLKEGLNDHKVVLAGYLNGKTNLKGVSASTATLWMEIVALQQCSIELSYSIDYYLTDGDDSVGARETCEYPITLQSTKNTNTYD